MRRFPCRAVARPAHPFGRPALLDRHRAPRMRGASSPACPAGAAGVPAGSKSESSTRRPRFRSGPRRSRAFAALTPRRRGELRLRRCAGQLGRSAQPHVAVSLDRPWAGGYLQPPRVRESPSPECRASAGPLLPPVRTRGRGGPRLVVSRIFCKFDHGRGGRGPLWATCRVVHRARVRASRRHAQGLLLVLAQIVHVEVAMCLQPVLVHLDREGADQP
jgi:hypothetical protein